jgi:hypothetical protein
MKKLRSEMRLRAGSAETMPLVTLADPERIADGQHQSPTSSVSESRNSGTAGLSLASTPQHRQIGASRFGEGRRELAASPARR